MKPISIGIYDSKLASEEQDDAIQLRNYLTTFVPKGVSITCNSEPFDPSLPEHEKNKIVFVHIGDYPVGRDNIINECKDKRHLYWVSSAPQTREDTLPDSSYEARGVNARLQGLEDYEKLNWEGAMEEWRKKLDEWKSAGHHGVIPRFPLKTLTKVSASFSIVLPFLIPLDLLLQGYLAIWRPEVIFGEDCKPFLEKHGIFQKTDQIQDARKKNHYSTHNDQRLFRPANAKAEVVGGEPSRPQDLGWFWFDECLPDVKEQPYENLEACEQLAGKSNLKMVWKLLRGECLRESDGNTLEEACAEWTQDDFTNIFEKAHLECHALFQADDEKKRVSDLERIRSLLNHNQVKNDFLLKLDAAGFDLPLEERGADIQAVWASLRGEDAKVGYLDSKIDAIRSGLASWQKLYKDLKDFFENVPEKYGFRLTDKGMQVQRDFFEGEASWTVIIDGFVREFDEIAHQPGDERFRRLEAFFDAADNIHTALSGMALEKDKNGLFGGHFESI